MNKQKLESVWKIIRANNFEENENINSEYLCTMCKKLLIDACSAHCGCRFCKSCITDYVKNEKKFCPGTSEYCKDDLINMDCDVHMDQTANIRICRLVVKCPNMGCETRLDIKSMENHLEMCKQRCASCPFISVGCEENVLQSDKINEHLLSKVHSHTKLLMGWVSISRNETESLKIEIEQLRSENCELKERIDRAEKIEKKNSSEFDKLGSKMKALKEENKSLKDELLHYQEDHYAEQDHVMMSVSNVEVQLQEVFEMGCQCQSKENRLDENLENQRKRSLAIEKKLDEMTLSNAAARKESRATTKSIESIREHVGLPKFGDFVWNIEGWTEKLKQAKSGSCLKISSKPFFSSENSYKMCLEVFPNGNGSGKGTHLSMSYFIMKGPNDGILRWPFKDDVEISLVNQKTGLAHVTKKARYSDKPDFVKTFEKPTGERNERFGFCQFAKQDEMLAISGVIEDDQIVIRCSVKSPQ